MVIHPEARTTPQIQAEIKATTGLTQKALAYLLVVMREFINPKASRAGLARTLKRYGVSNLNDMNESSRKHCLIKPAHPQTNGMVERFNGRIRDILKTTLFNLSEELSMTLNPYMKIYNHHIPQKNIGHLTPM